VKEFGKGKDNAEAQSAPRFAEEEKRKAGVKRKRLGGVRL